MVRGAIERSYCRLSIEGDLERDGQIINKMKNFKTWILEIFKFWSQLWETVFEDKNLVNAKSQAD